MSTPTLSWPLRKNLHPYFFHIQSVSMNIPPTESDILQENKWRHIQQIVQEEAMAGHRNVSILAATKYGSATQAAALIRAGASLIGENKIVDAEHKLAQLKQMDLPPFEAHLIGSLQRNKLRRAIQLFSCIQSLDRDSLLHALQTECHSQNRVIDGMLQINTANEPNKSGYTIDEITARHTELFAFPNIRIIGIMAVTPFSSDPEKTRPFFKQAHCLFSDLQVQYPALHHLSMGMSNDYRIAIQEGSTMVRLGSILYEH
jgi:pyridoxal phosphate enzyme (YggS family)